MELMQSLNERLKGKNIEEILKFRRNLLEKRTGGKKVNFEFQEIGLEMQKYFNQNIWFLFYRYPLDDIKKAFEICKTKKINKVGYIIGVLKKI